MTPIAAQQQILHGTWQEALEAIDWLLRESLYEKLVKHGWEFQELSDGLLLYKPKGRHWHKVSPEGCSMVDGKSTCESYRIRGWCDHWKTGEALGFSVEALAKKGV